MISIKYAIEAILFSSGDFVKVSRIAKALGIKPSVARDNIKRLQYEYETQHKGIMVLEADDSFSLCSNPEYYEAVREIIGEKRRQPLSNAAIEALTAIAYKQPVTRTQVEHIRGVNSDSAINRLLEKGLIEEAGRLDAPGKPILYKTTAVFLRSFGLKNLNELPPYYPAETAQTVFDLSDDTEIKENYFDKDIEDEIIKQTEE